MAVAHDAVTESHAGTTGSASEASFSWTHTPVGTPRGVLVFTNVNANADDATSVTYGGVALTAVSGGRAVNTTGDELGDSKAWFLGASIPTGAQSVVVNRNNNANVMYATAITVTALTDTGVHTPGIVLLETAGTIAEQNVDDGTPGTNSVRYAVVNSGVASVPTAGANSSNLHGIDFGVRTIRTVRETTAGQGSRLVGITEAGSDDRAMVHLAVREATGGGTQTLTGSLLTKAPTFPTGAITATRNLAGVLFTKAPTFPTGAVSLGAGPQTVSGVLFTEAPTFFTGTVTAGAVTLAGVLFTKAPTFPTGAVSLGSGTQALAGILFAKAPTFPTGTITAGVVSLTGVLFTKAPTFPTGVVSALGAPQALNGVLFTKAPTFSTGTITAGAVSLTGVLFTKAPTFLTGVVALLGAPQALTGVLFTNTPGFPAGTIGISGTIFGNLFVNLPVFFTGSMSQPGPTFWSKNPAAFVKVGPAGPSPWGTELSGAPFQKAPTFPVGAVT